MEQHEDGNHECNGGRGPNYFEVDIDVGSSKSAASVVGLVQGALKGLVIDMAITLEGHTKVHTRTHARMHARAVSGDMHRLQPGD